MIIGLMYIYDNVSVMFVSSREGRPNPLLRCPAYKLPEYQTVRQTD